MASSAAASKASASGCHAVSPNTSDAMDGFRRQVVINPDLIDTDKDRLKKKAEADLKDAFPGGGQAAITSRLARFENRVLSDLNLYDDPVPQPVS
jgi:hypothetical protein